MEESPGITDDLCNCYKLRGPQVILVLCEYGFGLFISLDVNDLKIITFYKTASVTLEE